MPLRSRKQNRLNNAVNSQGIKVTKLLTAAAANDLAGLQTDFVVNWASWLTPLSETQDWGLWEDKIKNWLFFTGLSPSCRGGE